MARNGVEVPQRQDKNAPKRARSVQSRYRRVQTAELAAADAYRVAAPKYLERGWQSPLPITARTKEGNLPRDRTGWGKPYPTQDEIEQWRIDRPADNVCLRMAQVSVGGETFDVVGIDVDHYDSKGKRKLGADQLAELESAYGALPATFVSTNRPNNPSGIRFFLAPARLRWKGKAAKDIDIVSPGYRFAVVEPSVHPDGRQYFWLDPDGQRCDAIPDPATAPMLPEAWVDLLTNGRTRDDGQPIDMDSSVDEIRRWAEATLPDYRGEPCDAMRGKGIEHWRRQIEEDASSHDKITGAHWHLACLAAEGHVGLGRAVAEVEKVWINDTVKARGKRGLTESKREIFRSRINALRKLKGEIDSGVREVAGECGCNEPERLAALADPEAWAEGIERMSADESFEHSVTDAENKLRVQTEARRRLSEELAKAAWREPPDRGSLRDQIANPEAELGWTVQDLIPERGIVQINAQYKAGKTTLASVNLPVSLVTGEPFLRQFEVKFARGECVGVWNLEVDEATYVGWMNVRDAPDDCHDRIHPLHLRGYDMNFGSPTVVEWTVNWLRDRHIAVWIIDPLSKLFRGEENSATEYNAWWAKLEEIIHRAGVRVAVIVHHTGHAGDGRARGTSAMMGNPDVLVEYRHGGDLGQLPPDNKRYLRAFGRRVNLSERTLSFDPATSELFVDGSGRGRAEDRQRALAMEAWHALKQAPSESLPLNQGQLLEAMGRRAKGKNNKDALDAIRYAERHGWIDIDDGGNGNAKRHSLGPNAPHDDQKMAVTLGPCDGEDDQ